MLNPFYQQDKRSLQNVSPTKHLQQRSRFSFLPHRMAWDFILGTAEHGQATPRTEVLRCLQEQTCRPSVQREPCSRRTCHLSQRVWETPISILGSRSCNYTDSLPPPNPAARAGGRQECSQHLIGMVQGDGVSSPRLSQQHCLSSAQPGCGLGSSTTSLMDFSPTSLSGRCPAN